MAQRDFTRGSTDRQEQARIAQRLRQRVRDALQGKGTIGEQELGISIQEFKRWIEAQWEKGMSWDNFGPQPWPRSGWELDHAESLASFDLRDPSQRVRAMHFRNYRPVWTEENRSKGARSVPRNDASWQLRLF